MVTTSAQPVGITDLSRKLGLAKGSIARLVATLVEQNCLVRDPKAGKYRLGMRIWELGHRALAGLDLHGVGHLVLGGGTKQTAILEALPEPDAEKSDVEALAQEGARDPERRLELVL